LKKEYERDEDTTKSKNFTENDSDIYK
jgi:hypothetical protein